RGACYANRMRSTASGVVASIGVFAVPLMLAPFASLPSAAAEPAAKVHRIEQIVPLDPSEHVGQMYPIQKNVLAGDRLEYDGDDGVAQFFASFSAPADQEAKLV